MVQSETFDRPFEWHLNVQNLKPLSHRVNDIKVLSTRLDDYIVETLRLLVQHEKALFPSSDHAALVDILKSFFVVDKSQVDIPGIWAIAVKVHGAAAGIRKEHKAQRAVVRFYENYLNVRLNGLLTYVTEIRLWMTADVIEELDVDMLRSIRKRIEIVRELEEVRADVSHRLTFELKKCSMIDWEAWVDARVEVKEASQLLCTSIPTSAARA